MWILDRSRPLLPFEGEDAGFEGCDELGLLSEHFVNRWKTDGLELLRACRLEEPRLDAPVAVMVGGCMRSGRVMLASRIVQPVLTIADFAFVPFGACHTHPLSIAD